LHWQPPFQEGIHKCGSKSPNWIVLSQRLQLRMIYEKWKLVFHFHCFNGVFEAIFERFLLKYRHFVCPIWVSEPIQESFDIWMYDSCRHYFRHFSHYLHILTRFFLFTHQNVLKTATEAFAWITGVHLNQLTQPCAGDIIECYAKWLQELDLAISQT
jgi:hypothetical protein